MGIAVTRPMAGEAKGTTTFTQFSPFQSWELVQQFPFTEKTIGS